MEERQDIIYIGDRYKTDVIGAHNAVIKAVWLNKNGEEDTNNLADFTAAQIDELVESTIQSRHSQNIK